jgi:hypothetical protein
LKLIILLSSDIENLFDPSRNLEGKVCYLPEHNRICPDLVAYCDEQYHKADIFVTGSQTVVSTLSARMLKDSGSYADILIWENGELLPVTQYSKQDWLAHFDLGDLYMRGELGKPKESTK